MEISYVREMRKNYLVAEAQEDFPGYEAHMLAANTIQGLLGMRIRYTDGRASYYYDITSRQPLGRLLEGRQITVGEICGLIQQIYGTLKRMEEFFLGDKGILLEPQYIYIEPETFQAGLCFVPGLEGNFSESLSRLLQYLLRQVDHRDKRAVILAYSLYQESLKENYSLEDLLSLMEDEGRKEAAGNNQEDQENGEEPDRRSFEEPGSREMKEHGAGEPEQPVHTGKKEKRAKENRAKENGGEKTRCVFPWRQGLAASVLVLLIPGILWVFRGSSVVLEYIKWIGVIQAAMLLIIWRIVWKRRQTGRLDAAEKKYIYEEIPIPDEPFFAKEEPQEIRKTDESFQTVLLNNGTDANMHRLEGVLPETEDIVIPYYPFVIGKHRELADYVLDRETVSRLHLRCDRNGDTYTVTDLNSTNGTMVGGVLLDANETVEVKSGDSVVIADAAYVWK